ncbi:hypothetical protein, partial [Leptolyngbya sp. FACHB-36]|uniref:hypothetical protein n=1 Tax=Leptolyngbya sp. FACHB-36 TaxID=2692808 RepID=UPI001A7EA699
ATFHLSKLQLAKVIGFRFQKPDELLIALRSGSIQTALQVLLQIYPMRFSGFCQGLTTVLIQHGRKFRKANAMYQFP